MKEASKENTLYIVGNGFDLYHGMKTRYWDFKEYVSEHDGPLAELLDRYYDEEQLWTSFEVALANLDTDSLQEDASDFLTSFADDDWSEGDNHNYQESISEIIDMLTVRLKEHFTAWVLQIEIKNDASQKLPLKQDALYMVFNYTSTLEKIYGIDKDSIFYVHNKAEDANSLLILGHGVVSQELGSRLPPRKIEYREDMSDEEMADYVEQEEMRYDAIADEDFRVTAGLEFINQYFIRTYKQTQEVINSNYSFFLGLSEISRIVVLGHSLGDVDMAYFQEIVNNIDASAVKWEVDYYSESNIDSKRKNLNAVGVKSENIEFFPTAALKP